MKFIKRIIKDISCKIGRHDWQIIKSMKLSNLIFIIKKSKPVLKNAIYDYKVDYIISNRECKICGTKDLELDNSKTVLTEELYKSIKKKKK